MPVYQITPKDIVQVFAGPAAAAWLSPTLIFNAIHAALHQAYPQIQLWEHNHATGKNGRYPSRGVRLQRFGSLTTIGPFFCLDPASLCTWLFPQPADLKCSTAGSLEFAAPTRNPEDRVPTPAMCADGAQTILGAGVNTQPGFLTKQAIELYLHGQLPPEGTWGPSEDYFDVEARPRPAARMPAANHSDPAVPQPALLRLRDHVCLGAHAAMPLKSSGYHEGLDLLIPDQGRSLLLGGSGRVATIRKTGPENLEHWLPLSAPVTGNRVKWLLLSPAIFPPQKTSIAGSTGNHPGGWLPNWICPDTGQVLLRRGDTNRSSASREDWRARIRHLPCLDCRLVAASLRGLTPVGGWSARRHLVVDQPEAQPGPKPVGQAVPAGSIYYFEGPDASMLAETLAWHGIERQNLQRIIHRRSTLMGEQGLGLGVCGPWHPPGTASE
jgi:hypothetical protein